ncbi:synaptonemal complex central element protein 1 [Thalassophryne amazonica]|uniref:synaptonemal complex central element protein 1 n=1 Tax=Thalassophryne amazonica TaxID=390379 RepID=UPI001470C4BE|nr:synaptonemal complex central element protein 1 [Thalassophryne amazonica]
MATFAGFNIESLLTPPKGDGEMQKPKVEQLMGKLRRLQKDKESLGEEVKKFKLLRDSLRKELVTLQTEAHQAEGIQKEKEELCRKMTFQCKECDKDTARQLQQSKISEELLAQYRCEIQEIKLKYRKLWIKSENQLQQLTEQHKTLHSIFTPARLPAEIESAENANSQLLSAEQMKLDQLRCLTEQLEKVKKLKQLETTPAESQVE